MPARPYKIVVIEDDPQIRSLVETILSVVERRTGKQHLRSLIEHVPDRPGHDRRYAIDWSDSLSKLGWAPKVDLEAGLSETVDWYLGHRDWWDNSSR